MMLVIVKGIVCCRAIAGLGMGTERYFDYVWHIVSHWGSSSGEKRLVFVPKMCLLISYIQKDPQKNALDCCWLKRTWAV